MDAKVVIHELKILHPGKRIFVNDEAIPTEILCELESAELNPDRSVYLAVIDTRVVHQHRQSKETFDVLRGNLILSIDGREYTVIPGKRHTILPGQVHYTEGHDTWVRVTSTPGWRPDGMHLVE